MADYKIAINKTLKNEGGYANDKDDKGGETYRGISRKFWPRWPGWKLIDEAKKQPNFPKSLSTLSSLKDMVVAFYRDNFWKPIGGDNIKSQRIGEQLVDSAVLEGIPPAIKRAQNIVGLSQTGTINNDLITRLNNLPA